MFADPDLYNLRPRCPRLIVVELGCKSHSRSFTVRLEERSLFRALCANIAETSASSFINVEGKEVGCHGGFRKFKEG